LFSSHPSVHIIIKKNFTLKVFLFIY
jgi:hypothetical protein